MAYSREKINELYPEATLYEAMLINKGNETVLKTACESGDYFGQLKKDGYFYQFEKHANFSYLFSRSVSTVTKLPSEKLANVPHIYSALSCLPTDTILIGEIYYPGGTSKNVTSIMGCLPEKAIERQKGSYGQIHYYIHDILMYNGVDLVAAKTGSWDRYQILKKIFEKHNLGQYDFLELAEAWDDDLYSRIGSALAAGEEGMVIKKKDAPYEPGKRPMSNLKAKKVDFIDAVVIGFEEPTKEYYGQEIESWGYNIKLEHKYLNDDILELNSFQENKAKIVIEKRLQGNYKDLCELYGKENITAVTKPYYYNWSNARLVIGAYDTNGQIQKIGVIHSGISDEMKEDMTHNPDKYLGKVCMIQCMQLDSKEHTIRHGFFKGMREDKDAHDCTLNAVFGQK